MICLISLCPNGKPVILLSFLIAPAKISIANKKRYGDRGSPCLTPRLILKYPVEFPPFITQLLISVYKTLTHDRNESPKPNLCKILNKKACATESKAFSKSTATK